MAALFGAACSQSAEIDALSRAPALVAPSTSTTATTAAPETPAALPDEAPVIVDLRAAAASADGDHSVWTMAPYHGFGAWLDAFDWSATFARDPSHLVTPAAIEHMAAEGVQTLYIQANRWNSETDHLEPERLQPLLDQAHASGIAVVAWYLPTFVDLETDLRRLRAIATLDIDGLAIDIEARDVADIAERNRRLVALSTALRSEFPNRVIGGIVLEPVLLEEVNDRYWPDFPWTEIAPLYDVWLPMSYWTNRRGVWRDAYTYSSANIDRVRTNLGLPDAPVHLIGGIGDKTTVADLQGMVLAGVERSVIGGSIYDYRTSSPAFWETLRQFRS